MNMARNADRDAAAGDEDVRVQHRLNVQEGPTGVGDASATRVGLALDVETTGISLSNGAIIELAMRRFRFDVDGVVTHLDRGYRWLEDPGFPIPAEITRLTGITDADVSGRRIADHDAVALLRSASLIVAHNAAFDRPWIEERLEAAAGLDWGCSMTQVDWQAGGFDGLSLGYLLRQAGWFHDAHSGEADVDAVIQLLQHRFDDGRTALSQLIDLSAEPSWMFSATGAAFAAKDCLRERGYRWNAEMRVWWKEVKEDDRTEEEFWLAANVYAAGKGARAMGPLVEVVDASTRYRAG